MPEISSRSSKMLFYTFLLLYLVPLSLIGRYAICHAPISLLQVSALLFSMLCCSGIFWIVVRNILHMLQNKEQATLQNEGTFAFTTQATDLTVTTRLHQEALEQQRKEFEQAQEKSERKITLLQKIALQNKQVAKQSKTQTGNIRVYVEQLEHTKELLMMELKKKEEIAQYWEQQEKQWQQIQQENVAKEEIIRQQKQKIYDLNYELKMALHLN